MLLAGSVAEKGECDVGETVEDYEEGDEDFPGGEVEVVDGGGEKAEDYVVYEGEGETGAYGVVWMKK